MGFIAFATFLTLALYIGLHIILLRATFAGFALVRDNKRIPDFIKTPLFAIEIIVGIAWPFIVKPELPIKEKLAFSLMGLWMTWIPNLAVLLIDLFCYYHLPRKQIH